MAKSSFFLAVAGFIVSISNLAAIPAHALVAVTFVSGKGVDTGTCASPTTPCRTFNYAIGQTSPGGEIKALDASNYSAVYINKSISITGVEGAGILKVAAGDAIVIVAGASDRINLSTLTLDGFKTGATGIKLYSGGSLTIENCVVRNFLGDGISLNPSGALKFLLANVVLTDDSFSGLYVAPNGGGGSVVGVLDHVVANNNKDGVYLYGSVTVTANDSVAANNVANGFYIGKSSFLRLTRSTATRNVTGVLVSLCFPSCTGGTAQSAGNNFIRGNTTDVFGALTNVGTQ